MAALTPSTMDRATLRAVIAATLRYPPDNGQRVPYVDRLLRQLWGLDAGSPMLAEVHAAQAARLLSAQGVPDDAINRLIELGPATVGDA